MAFKLNMRGVECVRRYREALAMFEGAKPRMRGGSGQRKLPGKEKNPDTGISMGRDGEIQFWYHGTPVVIWRQNDDCVINLSWASISTQSFARNFLPYRTDVFSCCRIVAHEGRYYRASDEVIIRGRSGDVDGYIPFRRETVNRDRAKVALAASGYTPFAKWYRVQASFWKENLHKGALFSGSDPVEAIRNPGNWDGLLTSTHFGYAVSSTRFLDKLRGAIYRNSHVYDIEEVPWADSYHNATKWR